MPDSVYFITGATGFIGRALCERLRAENKQVRALVRRPRDEALEGIGVQLVHGDLLESSSYAAALEGVDVVMHLGADATYKNGHHYDIINRKASAALAKQAELRCPKLQRFVFVSTLGAVDRAPTDRCDRFLTEASAPHPTTDYGRSKLAAEQDLAATQLPWSVIRPAMVVGPAMREDSHVSQFARMALRGSPIAQFNLPGRMGMVHIDDLVDALLLAARSPHALKQVFFAASDNVALGAIFSWVSPGRRLPVPLPRAISRFFPFKVKALVLDAMAVDSAKLRGIGWDPKHKPEQTVNQISRVQAARLSPRAPVDGITVITGAASGLGAALAHELAAHSRKLILIDRDGAALDGVLAGNADVLRVVADLGDGAGLSRLLQQDFWKNEPIDELYLCAGFGGRGKIDELSGKLQAQMMIVNVGARIHITRHALPGMLARKRGRIVLISSSSAFQPLPFMAAYAASNSAVLSFGEALASELQGTGVQALTVCPGGMKTAFQKSAGVKVLPNERLDEPADVARGILDALEKKQPLYFVGTRSLAMSLLARGLPRAWNVALWKKLMLKLR